MPFAIDEYETLPPPFVRQNPAYYHCLLKNAGFESEHGWVDYKIRVTPELTERYESALEATRLSGYEIIPAAAIPERQRAREFNDVLNDAFRDHWGFPPFIDAQWTELLDHFAQFGVLDTSVLAYRGSDPIGMLVVITRAHRGCNYQLASHYSGFGEAQHARDWSAERTTRQGGQSRHGILCTS